MSRPERELERRVEMLTAKQGREVHDKLALVGSDVTDPELLTIDVPKWAALYAGELESVLTELIKLGYLKGKRKLRAARPKGIKVDEKPIGFDVFDPNVVHWMQEYPREFGERVNRNFAEAITQHVATGLEQGMGVRELRQSVDDRFFATEPNRYRANMIARTEATRANNAGQMMSWQQSGVVVAKKWIVMQDHCPWCHEMDGRIIPLDGDFHKFGGDMAVEGAGTMRFGYEDVTTPPLHPLCRCDLEAVFDVAAATAEDQGTAAPTVPDQAVPQPVDVSTLNLEQAEHRFNTEAERLAVDMKGTAQGGIDTATRARDVAQGEFHKSRNAVDEYFKVHDPTITGVPFDYDAPEFVALTKRQGELSKLYAKADGALDAARAQAKASALARLKVAKPAAQAPKWSGSYGKASPKRSAAWKEGSTRRKMVEDGFADFNGLCSREDFKAGDLLVQTKRGRAHARLDGKGIVLSGTSGDPTVVAHEIAHCLETQSPAVRRRCKEFYQKRCDSKPLEKLSKKYPGYGYRKNELYRPGGFGNEYASKWYDPKDYKSTSGVSSFDVIRPELLDGDPPFTEVLTQGITELERDPIGFAEKDFDHFRFTIGILRGML